LEFNKYLLSGGVDKTLRLWDINEEGKLIASVKVHSE